MRFSFPTICLLLLLVGSAAASAQSSRNYGTIYSQFGLGERASFSSSQSAMMGGAAVGLRSGTYPGIDNPALWSDQSLAQLSVSAHVQGLRAEDASGEQSRLTSGSLGALQLSLPLLSNRLGLTFAFRPYTRVDYLAVRDGLVLDPEIPSDSITYRLNFEGNGGLQQARLGLGYRLGQALAVGASVDVLFGSIEYLQRTEFPASNIAETRTRRTTSLRGVGGTLGAVVSATGLLGEADAFSLGATVSLPTRLAGDRVQTLGYSLDQDTLRTEVHGDVTVPLQLAAGLSYLPNSRWTLAADVRYEPWSDFESDFAFGGFDPAADLNQLRDRVRVGGGFQVIPAGTDRLAPYFARTAYRLGGYYDRAYFEAGTADPTTISTLALTGGLSLPALIPTARFDLGFEVGTRGTTERGLVRDLFIKGSATINFGERWFQRRQLG